MSEYEVVIGLEVHCELDTNSKMFCSCPTHFGAEPNTNVCEVCLGEPGTLPVVNERAVEDAIKIGLALNCSVADTTIFHRKNYFYPDMPKNYQISQYDTPICVKGWLEIDGARIGVTRVHMEEDTGKSLHLSTTGRIADASASLVDYNRAGVPLMEIVGEPDIRTPEQAMRYFHELRSIIDTLGVSDVRMEEGSLRCDANVSLRTPGAPFGTRVEIKNLNSIRSLGRALQHEIERQTKLLQAGESIVQETRHFDEGAGVTKTLRSKEEAFDYRYFPEPDLVPIEPDQKWVASLKAALPELPAARRERLRAEHGLGEEHALYVGASAASMKFFEESLAAGAPARDVAVWMSGELARWLSEKNVSIDASPVPASSLASLIDLVSSGKINLNTGKRVLQLAFETGKDPATIVVEEGLEQVTDTGAIDKAIDDALAQNSREVERYKAGEDKVLNFLFGQVMKVLKGQGNPAVIRERLTAKLNAGTPR
ncbi:MAG: Asp-tRNA(Asn)/Glu-tRNA(Gln) amidotransferase subunit GatB [Actinomycetota bacterium]